MFMSYLKLIITMSYLTFPTLLCEYVRDIQFSPLIDSVVMVRWYGTMVSRKRALTIISDCQGLRVAGRVSGGTGTGREDSTREKLLPRGG